MCNHNSFTLLFTALFFTVLGCNEAPQAPSKVLVPGKTTPVVDNESPHDTEQPQQDVDPPIQIDPLPSSPSKIVDTSKDDSKKGDQNKQLPDPIDKENPLPLGIKTYEETPTAPRSIAFTITQTQAKAAITGHPAMSTVVSRMSGNAAGPLAGKTLEVVHGNIITQQEGASFNAANGNLEGGGGLDGAYGRATNQKIYEECKAYKKRYNNNMPVPTGAAVITKAVPDLKVDFVVHVVGPSGAANQQNQNLLYTAILGGLHKANKQGVKTVSIPAVSTGIYGFNLAKGVEIIVNAARDYFEQNPATSIEKVRFVSIDMPSTAVQKTARQFWQFFADLATP